MFGLKSDLAPRAYHLLIIVLFLHRCAPRRGARGQRHGNILFGSSWILFSPDLRTLEDFQLKCFETHPFYFLSTNLSYCIDSAAHIPFFRTSSLRFPYTPGIDSRSHWSTPNPAPSIVTGRIAIESKQTAESRSNIPWQIQPRLDWLSSLVLHPSAVADSKPCSHADASGQTQSLIFVSLLSSLSGGSLSDLINVLVSPSRKCFYSSSSSRLTSSLQASPSVLSLLHCSSLACLWHCITIL